MDQSSLISTLYVQGMKLISILRFPPKRVADHHFSPLPLPAGVVLFRIFRKGRGPFSNISPPKKVDYHHFPFSPSLLVLVFMHPGPAVKYVDTDTLTSHKTEKEYKYCISRNI